MKTYYSWNIAEHIDPYDSVGDTVASVVRSVVADVVGHDMIRISDAVHVETGGGCSASVISVLTDVDGAPIIIGQLVLWEGDVAPSSPWLPMVAGWFRRNDLYDSSLRAFYGDDTVDENDHDNVGSAECHNSWGNDDGTPLDCIGEMMLEGHGGIVHSIADELYGARHIVI